VRGRFDGLGAGGDNPTPRCAPPSPSGEVGRGVTSRGGVGWVAVARKGRLDSRLRGNDAVGVTRDELQVRLGGRVEGPGHDGPGCIPLARSDELVDQLFDDRICSSIGGRMAPRVKLTLVQFT
jgi:hypothetical protein